MTVLSAGSPLLMLKGFTSPQLAVQVAVVISKIARVDYPKAWPDLFQTLLALLSEATSRHTEQRTLLVLHHVLKELASKRLQSDQRAFEAVAALLTRPPGVPLTLRCPSYRGASAALTLNLSARRQVEQQSSMAAEVRAGLEEFWGAEDRRPRLLRSLVLRYIPLTSEDLEEWAVGPEAFHHALMNVAWEESVRGCAENLALALFEGHRKELAPVAVGLLHAACASPNVLEREAAYRLVAVAAEELHGALDFPAWLHSTLLPEAHGANLAAARPSPNPLRRAALLLPGHWLGELKSEDRMALHTTMLCALGRECDMAVRLAALVTLRALVDDWSFEHAEYTPFVASSFEAVGAMLQDATELDTQLQAFDYLNTLIGRLREGVALGTLSRVLCALGLDSPAVHPALLPALHAALDPSADCGVCEDGLQTWLVALRCSPDLPGGGASPLLSDLWARAWPSAMDGSTEHVAVGCRIATSALLLGGPSFLAQHGAGLAATLAAWLVGVNDRGAAHAAHTLALACQTAARGLMRVWLDHLDAVGRPGQRVLHALGLAAMLPAPVQGLLGCLGEVTAHYSATSYNVVWAGSPSREGAARDALRLDFLPPPPAHDEAEAVASEDAVGEGRRRDALWQADPVHTLSMRGFMREQLEAAAATHGKAGLLKAAADMDPSMQSELWSLAEADGD
ncbi:Importin-11 [Auxenochlorella protothecoides]|uniref:Importin-11 n=1 Tax=Auxenochlorella protothecoides TaxID=3075 RepID=A0A087SQS8_AUXPR|nr:Importin-11 [Auxenochlorella protothecoides]KFM28082.1 Importin-11 [Auxenochlorella protothecoides]